MTGPENYRLAEQLVAEAADASEHGDTTTATLALTAAQVHATLALAAATALNGAGDDDMPSEDWHAWHRAAGVQKPSGGGR